MDPIHVQLCAALACLLAAVTCDATAFLQSGDPTATYAAVPEYLPVGHVIHSQCEHNSGQRFGPGTVTETIKCTARGRVGLLNQSPSGCHGTTAILSTSAFEVTYRVAQKSDTFFVRLIDFVKYWPIFKRSSLSESGENL